jgi:hypothetical protein
MGSIFIVANGFLKMANFIACQKTINASQIAHLYFKEMVHLHEVPVSISLD